MLDRYRLSWDNSDRSVQGERERKRNWNVLISTFIRVENNFGLDIVIVLSTILTIDIIIHVYKILIRLLISRGNLLCDINISLMWIDRLDYYLSCLVCNVDVSLSVVSIRSEVINLTEEAKNVKIDSKILKIFRTSHDTMINNFFSSRPDLRPIIEKVSKHGERNCGIQNRDRIHVLERRIERRIDHQLNGHDC